MDDEKLYKEMHKQLHDYQIDKIKKIDEYMSILWILGFINFAIFMEIVIVMLYK